MRAPTVGKIHQLRANQLFVTGLPVCGLVLRTVVQLLSKLPSGAVRLFGATYVPSLRKSRTSTVAPLFEEFGVTSEEVADWSSLAGVVA